MTNSDFMTDFVIHPIKGDLALLRDVAAISNRVKNLVFTNPYERPFQPALGAGIPRTLFDNMTPDTQALLEARIRDCINNYEPCATNVKVAVALSVDRNQYTATIIYTPINTNTPVTVEAIFKRIR